tara:strand:+ start:547 stop:669 length:123 start_codon:yes stop_codon:yes gene_type:complete
MEDILKEPYTLDDSDDLIEDEDEQDYDDDDYDDFKNKDED